MPKCAEHGPPHPDSCVLPTPSPRLDALINENKILKEQNLAMVNENEKLEEQNLVKENAILKEQQTVHPDAVIQVTNILKMKRLNL